MSEIHPKAGRPQDAPSVKFIAAVLLGGDIDFDAALSPELEQQLGRIDYRSEPHPFTVTDYYEDEMGPGLERLIVSFEPLGEPTDLVRIKIATARIEERLAVDGARRVNIDPGYMDYFKIVLASFKEGPQKIYVGDGVYADPVLLFQNGAFEPLPWSFPDFRAGSYTDDLMAIRRIYKSARKMKGLAPYERK
ncbi:MAG: DUF4416 family protein [bacterium]|nr:MAG: DUF4416 family protein [bacterium]